MTDNAGRHDRSAVTDDVYFLAKFWTASSIPNVFFPHQFVKAESGMPEAY
jgi:hypothetical protein